MNNWTPLFALSSDENNSRWTLTNIALAVVLASTVLLGLGGFLTMGTDLWDGAIVAHAIAIDRPDVYHEWFREAGLFFTPYIYDVVYFARGLVGYELLAKLLTLLFLCLASVEIAKLVKRYFLTPPSVATYAGLLFFLSPAWVLYYSNIYLMHSFSLFLTLLCTRFLLERRLLWLALPALLLSFQQSSDAPLAISLILLSSVYIHIERKDRIINAALILFVIAGFFLLRKLFPTYGLYAGYNKIDLYNLLKVRDYLKYFKYFLVLYSPFFIVISIALFLNRNLLTVKHLAVVIAGIMLNGVAYVAVGKLPSAYEVGLMHGETLRSTFTSTVFVALLFPVFWQALSSYPRARVYAAALLICYASGLSIYAHEGKMKEVLFQRGMIAELKKMPDLPKCVINIKSEGVATLTTYEYGDIFYKAYGETVHLPLGDSDNPALETENTYKNFFKESYRHKYFLPQKPPSCVSELYVKTDIARWSLATTLGRYFSGDNSAIVTINRVRLR